MLARIRTWIARKEVYAVEYADRAWEEYWGIQAAQAEGRGGPGRDLIAEWCLDYNARRRVRNRWNTIARLIGASAFSQPLRPPRKGRLWKA